MSGVTTSVPRERIAQAICLLAATPGSEQHVGAGLFFMLARRDVAAVARLGQMPDRRKRGCRYTGTIIWPALDQKDTAVEPNRIASVLSLLLALVFLGGCGAVTVRHVPAPPSLIASQIPELGGTTPLDIQAGQSSATDIVVGTVGVGTVVGNLHYWTNATVAFVKAELARAGATVRPGAAKVMTVSVAKAQLSALPVVGGATSTITIAVKTTNGTSHVFEGSGSSLAPLRAINAATSDAVRMMLADPEISTFLRR